MTDGLPCRCGHDLRAHVTIPTSPPRWSGCDVCACAVFTPAAGAVRGHTPDCECPRCMPDGPLAGGTA